MAKAYVLYNPLAGGGIPKEELEALYVIIGDKTEFYDITKAEPLEEIFFSLEQDDYIVLCGGDGTVNRFVNAIDQAGITNKILYCPTGNGNDFALDIGYRRGDDPFSINEYISRLPNVRVNGVKRKFINGVGYGLDGYCCLKGEEGKKKNYTAIAIDGLLNNYSPTGATVTVDGVSKRYEKVWLAPTMFGRYYGGGMLPAPGQQRDKDTLSVTVIHGAGRLKALTLLPSIFKGKHLRYKKYVEVMEGKDITVAFDSPRPLQVDGEVINNVLEYRARI